MGGWDVISIIGATAAIAAAVFARGQAKAAKSQADAARAQAEAAVAQLDLVKRQVETAEKANSLTEQLINDEREARRFHLTISARPQLVSGMHFLDVRVENNSSQRAIVTDIAVVFGNGKVHREGFVVWQSEGPPSPYKLPPVNSGGSFIFRFAKVVQQFGKVSYASPDYREAHWRTIDRIEVQANNLNFALDGSESAQQPAHWKGQFQNMTPPGIT